MNAPMTIAREAAEYLPDPKGRLLYVKGCPTCEAEHRAGNDFFPSHFGSGHCRSGSLASGGHRSHCSCGTCF